MAAASQFDESKQAALVAAISMMLKIQKALSGGSSIEDSAGNINREALATFTDSPMRRYKPLAKIWRIWLESLTSRSRPKGEY